jgi:hypothetical protein
MSNHDELVAAQALRLHLFSNEPGWRRRFFKNRGSKLATVFKRHSGNYRYAALPPLPFLSSWPIIARSGAMSPVIREAGTAPKTERRLREARESGHHLLYKPVRPMAAGQSRRCQFRWRDGSPK